MYKVVFSFFLAILLSLSLKAQDNSALQTEVMMKMSNLREALLSKDSAALSKLINDDATYGHSNGMNQTRAELIHSIVTGEQVYNTIEPSNIKVRIYNNTTGVVTINLKVNITSQGNSLDLNLAATFVWVRINGDWKLVARQAVRLA